MIVLIDSSISDANLNASDLNVADFIYNKFQQNQQA